MNENKTAITEMREWLEREMCNPDSVQECEKTPLWHGYHNAYFCALTKARALEASQAEKDKGLVEELKKEIRSRSYSYENDECNTQVIPVGDLLKILSRHQSNPIDPDYNKHEVAMNGHGIPVYPECGTKIEACGDCSDYAEFKAWKVPAPKPEAKTVDSVEFPCPTCGAERFKTERRMNGDSWCRFGHKHPTKDFVRPATLEPLAVLAVNRGCQVAWIGTYKSNPLMWSIEVQNAKKTEVFNAPTYAACEQLARTWLEEQKEGKV